MAFIKQGGDGSRRHPGRVWTVPAHPVRVICGLGAGDAFGAALVHGLLAGWDPVTCAEYANAAGAFVAARLACADAMPTMPELEAMVRRHDAAPPGPEGKP
jgi:5-dehydro-2-deoxygluconokinase